MSSKLISVRAFGFACRILKLCETVATRGYAGRHIAFELMKCGTSIGANVEEAQEGQTKRDFIAKLAISRKESRETQYWLRVAVATSVLSQQEGEWALTEAGELLAMLRAAIQTAQRNDSRERRPPPESTDGN